MTFPPKYVLCVCGGSPGNLRRNQNRTATGRLVSYLAPQQSVSTLHVLAALRSKPYEVAKFCLLRQTLSSQILKVYNNVWLGTHSSVYLYQHAFRNCELLALHQNVA